MMYEQKVDLAVHVGSNENLAQWKKISYGKITIELVERTKLMDYLTRENIDIYVKHERSVINHRMTVYHFTSWPSNDQFESHDSNNFLALITWIKRDIGKPTNDFTIASHDSFGGVEGASSFIVLFQMVEDLETKLKVRKSELAIISRERENGSVNIFEKVNGLRKARAHMISTFPNYRFLHATLAHYAKNRQTFEKILKMVEPPNGKNELSMPRVEASNNVSYENEYFQSGKYYENDHLNEDLGQEEPNNDNNYQYDIYVN